MRKDIHPEYNECKVTCVCGNEFTTRSTLNEISVEICSACHPFFTGQQRLVDSAGRVDRFLKKYGSEFGGALVEGGAVDVEKREAKESSSDAATVDEKPSADN